MLHSLRRQFLAGSPGFVRAAWSRVEASPLGYRLARGAFWSLIGTVVSRALGVASSVLVARMLGKTGMGELGIIQSTVGIFSAFAGLGMGLTATKFVAEDRVKNPERAGAMLSLSATVTWVSGALMTLVILLLAPWFAEHTLAAPHLAGLIRIGSLLLLLGAVNGAQTGALAGFEAFKTIAWVNLASGLSSFPLMVAGAWWFGLNGAVWGLIGSLAANCVVSHLALRREAAAAGVPITGKLQPEHWKILWRFSLPSVLCSVLYGPVNWACSALLVNRPNGYAEMGIFNVTLSWFGAVTFLPGILSQVLLPMLSGESAASGPANSRKLALLATKANLITSIPVTLLICCGSPLIMDLYGADFHAGWPTLVLSVLAAAVIAIHAPAAQSIIADGRMWPYFAMYAAWAIAYLAATFFLVSGGALGLAGARLIAYALGSTAVIGYAARYCWSASVEAAPAAVSAPVL